MVAANFIARYEVMRALLEERFELLGEEAVIVDDEACRLDAELVALERLLPEDYRYWNEAE